MGTVRKWFNALGRRGRMLARVTLTFTAALSFWFFYYNAVFQARGVGGNLPYLGLSIVAFGLFVYLEAGRRG